MNSPGNSSGNIKGKYELSEQQQNIEAAKAYLENNFDKREKVLLQKALFGITKATLDKMGERKDELLKKKGIEGMKTYGDMSPYCRTVINIPAHYGEKQLKKTLMHYTKQKNKDFEINLLINAPDGIRIEETKAYQDALQFFNEQAPLIDEKHKLREGVEALTLQLDNALNDKSIVDFENLQEAVRSTTMLDTLLFKKEHILKKLEDLYERRKELLKDISESKKNIVTLCDQLEMMQLDKLVQIFSKEIAVFEELLHVMKSPKKYPALSKAVHIAQDIQEHYKKIASIPAVDLNIATLNLQKGELTMGRLRKILAGITFQRFIDSGQTNLHGLFLVSNDADLIDLPNNYTEKIINTFDAKDDIGGLTGRVKYSRESYFSDHLFLTVQRITDAYESISRIKEKKIIMRGGNSAFRADVYIASEGYKRGHKKAETSPLKQWLEKQGRHLEKQTIEYSPLFNITTSARRQIVAIGLNVPLAERYEHFGATKDLAHEYHKQVHELVFPNQAYKVSDPYFTLLLQEQLQAFYNKARSFLDEEATEGEDVMKVQYQLKRASALMGVKIRFEKEQILVDDISKLKEGIVQKYTEH